MSSGRIRTIKPDFFRSPDTARVSFEVRIFYQALWCWADDFGIGETNINGLLGFAFCDEDEVVDPDTGERRAVSAQDVRRFCADVAQHFGVTFYTVRGRHYYHIPSWEKHQKIERRAQRRKYPTPDDPESAPDKRFHPGAESAPQLQRKTGADSRKSCEGTGEQGNRGTGDSAKAGHEIVPADDTTQTLIAEWIDHCDQRPPGRVIGQISKEVKTLLDEGQPYTDVRKALQTWQRKGLHPSTLASVLHESRTTPQANTKQQRNLDILAAAEQRWAEQETA